MKKEILNVKDWLKAKPHFIIQYDIETFVPYAKRLNDKKRFDIGNKFLFSGMMASVESFNDDWIHVDILIHDEYYMGISSHLMEIDRNEL